MDKRAFIRVPSFLNGKLFYNDNAYDALILNLSENGIYFCANAHLPSGLNIEISLPVESTELMVSYNIVRMTKIGNLHSRFGAEVSKTSQEYTKFINDRIASMQIW